MISYSIVWCPNKATLKSHGLSGVARVAELGGGASSGKDKPICQAQRADAILAGGLGATQDPQKHQLFRKNEPF